MDNNATNVFNEFRKFLDVLKNHLKMIIVMTILTAAVFAVAVFFFIKPEYQSTTQMIVSQKVTKSIEDSQMQQLQQADVQLVNTYKGIITSPTVSSRVQAKLGYNSLAQKSKVNVDTQPNSQVFDINVKSKSPQTAAVVANTTARVFQKRLKHVMRSSRANVIAKAKPNPSPVFPKKSLSILLGALVGLVLGIVMALFKEYSARTVTSMDYLTKDLGLTSLGIVDDINLKNIEQDSIHMHEHHGKEDE